MALLCLTATPFEQAVMICQVRHVLFEPIPFEVLIEACS